MQGNSKDMPAHYPMGMTIMTDHDRMEKNLHRIYQDDYGIPASLIAVLDEAEESLSEPFSSVDALSAVNQLRLLREFQQQEVTDFHLNGSTGYGYGDVGRETLEAIFAGYFGGEAALVRSQIVSGTHALAIGLYGLLQPGDGLISAAGPPYDTLRTIIGSQGEKGSLLDIGVQYKEIPLAESQTDPQNEGLPSCVVDLPCLLAGIEDNTRVVLFQRSKGYDWRHSISIQELSLLIQEVKEKKADLICLVDNCYCEMTGTVEPGTVGADLVIGSLIKNPGGTLAPGGGYIVGREDLVQDCVRRMLAPGLRADLGASLGFNRLAYQGLFQAPFTVGQSLKGAMLAAAFFHRLGYPVMPEAGGYSSLSGGIDRRSDIVQGIRLDDREKLIRFCQGIQKACPLDAVFTPEPSMLPGYNHPVIMAGGGFVQGSSSELSADGPLRPPYIAYLQGGSSLAQIRLGLLLAACAL